MRLSAILLCLFVSAVPLLAKPKPATRAYARSCEETWKAVKTVVQGNYDVLSLNDATQSGSFTTGSVWSGVRPIAFSLSGAANSCTVSVTGHFSGLIHNDKGSFFGRIEKVLTNPREVNP